MRLALAQFDSTIGEVDGNLHRIEQAVAEANGREADLIVLPELATHGYWLGQVTDTPSLNASDPRLVALSGGRSDVVVGFHEQARVRSYNAAGYFAGGELVHVHRKLYLPTYHAWEERKHSSPGQTVRAFDTAHGRVALLICNDAWQPVLPWLAAQDGAELVIVPTNSAEPTDPEAMDTIEYWEQLLVQIARMQQCWLVFVNRAGTEAGARFWGGSRVLDPSGAVVAQAPYWDEAMIFVDIDFGAAHRRRRRMPFLAEARLALIEREVRRLLEEGGDT
jgi:predicted amidohydrolase